MKYQCYGAVAGTKYLGEVEADSEEEAKEKALELDTMSVHVCHQCSDQISDPEVQEITVEPV